MHHFWKYRAGVAVQVSVCVVRTGQCVSVHRVSVLFIVLLHVSITEHSCFSCQPVPRHTGAGVSSTQVFVNNNKVILRGISSYDSCNCLTFFHTV